MKGVVSKRVMLCLAGALFVNHDVWAEDGSGKEHPFNHELSGGTVKVQGKLHRHVALTVDGIPDNQILEAFDTYGVTATFFMDPKYLEDPKNQDHISLIKELDNDVGFLIHHRTVRLKPARMFFGKLGPQVEVFRLQTGNHRLRLVAAARALGLTQVGWTVSVTAKNRRTTIPRLCSGGGIVRFISQPESAALIETVLASLERSNCTLIANGEEPVIPVSLHYFVRDGHKSRSIPEHVQQRTEAYRRRLVERCEPATKPLPVGDFPAQVKSHIKPACSATPLARGCMTGPRNPYAPPRSAPSD